MHPLVLPLRGGPHATNGDGQSRQLGRPPLRRPPRPPDARPDANDHGRAKEVLRLGQEAGECVVIRISYTLIPEVGKVCQGHNC